MPLTDHLMDQTELLEFANDAIILTDADGTITYWNQGACRTYGWEKRRRSVRMCTLYFAPSFPATREISNTI